MQETPIDKLLPALNQQFPMGDKQHLLLFTCQLDKSILVQRTTAEKWHHEGGDKGKRERWRPRATVVAGLAPSRRKPSTATPTASVLHSVEQPGQPACG
jgi:hypothetical protein